MDGGGEISGSSETDGLFRRFIIGLGYNSFGVYMECFLKSRQFIKVHFIFCHKLDNQTLLYVLYKYILEQCWYIEQCPVVVKENLTYDRTNHVYRKF